MPTIDHTIFDHFMFLVLVAVMPFEGLRRFRTLRAELDAGLPNARLREYRNVLFEEWPLTAVIIVGWFVLNRGAAAIGLVPLFTTPALIGYGLTMIVIGYLLFESRMVAGSAEKREEARKALAPVAAVMPHTRREKHRFGVVAVTAGICEELLYRGFLFAYLATWLPGSPTWLIIVIGGLFFGVAHLYQGGLGIVKTGVVGLVLGGLYWLTGSLWAPMLLHAVIDLNSGWIGWRVNQEDSPDEAPAPEPA